jgi:tRNA-binding protein
MLRKESRMSEPAPPFEPAGSASIEDVARLDIRVGRILRAAPLEGARRPAYRLVLDFGAAGQRQSSARITDRYPDPEGLVGRLVVAVVNLPPRRIAGYRSDVLVLGAIDGETVLLLSADEGARPGSRVG